MQDFTLTTYKKLLEELLASGYSFQTFQDFIQRPEKKTVILRHDVDRKPGNSLVIAKIEKEAGIKASYYFRIVKESYDKYIIKKIAEMGHEIGYHYENLSEISKKKRVTSKEELYELAIDNFRLNLEKLRKLYPVKTICMHGSPLSKWDNRDLWKRYNYRDHGIIAEPYFDVDFDEVFYLTDTGRRWDGDEVSVRDKVKGTEVGGRRSEVGDRISAVRGLRFRHTWDIIEAAENGLLPDKIMLNTHPQRWDDRFWPWMKELVWQNFKNVIKRYLLKFRN
jgi:hypothetical protein